MASIAIKARVAQVPNLAPKASVAPVANVSPVDSKAPEASVAPVARVAAAVANAVQQHQQQCSLVSLVCLNSSTTGRQ